MNVTVHVSYDVTDNACYTHKAIRMEKEWNLSNYENHPIMCNKNHENSTDSSNYVLK